MGNKQNDQAGQAASAGATSGGAAPSSGFIGKTGKVLDIFRPEYTPTYYENPRRVARIKKIADIYSQRQEMPEWVDMDAINAAYKYFQYVNDGKPESEWKYLHPDDPARQYLQSIPVPPVELLYEREKAQSQIYGAALGDFGTEEQQTAFEDLPAWQQWAINIMGSPLAQGGPTALLGGILGLGLGPLGGLAGAGVGYWAGVEAAKHPEGSVAQVLSYLDYPAEYLERGIGVGTQILASIMDPEAHGSLEEVLGNLKYAWEAGATTYAVSDWAGNTGVFIQNFVELMQEAEWYEKAFMPTFISYLVDNKARLTEGYAGPGEVWVLGVAEPVAIESPKDIAAIVEARRRMMAGEEPEVVINDVMTRYGFSGQLSKILGHMAADPLNLVPQGTAKGVIAKGAELAGNEPLAIAMRTAGRPVEGIQMYKNFIRMGMVAETADELTAFQRFLGGITETGTIKELELYTPPTGNVVQRTWAHLTSLTPESKAQAFVGMAHENMGALLTLAQKDPDKMVAMIRSWADLPPKQAAEIASFLGAPEAYTVRQAVTEFLDIADGELAGWVETASQRNLLLAMSEVLGESPADVLARFGDDADLAALFERLGQRAGEMDTPGAKLWLEEVESGRLTADNFKGAFDVYTKGDTPIPWHPDEFQANLHAQFIEHTTSWVIDAFNVKTPNALNRFSATLKAGQSLLLLGFNPNYLVNNVVDNTVKLAMGGVFGYVSPKAITAWMDRFGVEGFRMRAGIGVAQVGADIAGDVTRLGTGAGDIASRARGVSSQMIRQATEATDALGKIQKGLGKVNDLGVFSRLSGYFEKVEGQQGFFIGMRQAWNRLWQRGVGYSNMPAPLERMLTDIDPRLPGVVYGAVEQGLNVGEISQKLLGETVKYNLDGHLYDIAREMGMDVADVKDMLVKTGVWDTLDESLPKARTQSQISDVFRKVDQEVQDALDRQVQKELAVRVEDVRNQVAGEGFAGATRIFDDLQWYVEETWTRQFVEWGDTFDLAEGMRKPARDKLIQAQKANAAREWARIRKFEEASYLGMFEALGADSPATARYMDFLAQRHGVWDEFYNLRNALHDEFFSLDPKAPVPMESPVFPKNYRGARTRGAAWESVQDMLQTSYLDAAAREAGILEKMDVELVDIFRTQFGDNVAAQAEAWRAGARELKNQRAQMMAAFREEAKGLKGNAKRVKQKEFYQGQNLEMIRNYYQAEVQGGHDLYRAATGDIRGEGPVTQEASRLVETVEGGGIPTQMTSNLRRILLENGFSEADIRTRPINEMIAELQGRVGGPKVADEVVIPAGEGVAPAGPGEIPIDPRKIRELSKTPRAGIPDDISQAMLEEAIRMFEEIEVYTQMPGGAKPDWLAELQKTYRVGPEGGLEVSNITTIRNALERIIEDAGSDRAGLKTVRAVKETILNRIREGGGGEPGGSLGVQPTAERPRVADEFVLPEQGVGIPAEPVVMQQAVLDFVPEVDDWIDWLRGRVEEKAPYSGEVLQPGRPVKAEVDYFGKGIEIEEVDPFAHGTFDIEQVVTQGEKTLAYLPGREQPSGWFATNKGLWRAIGVDPSDPLKWVYESIQGKIEVRPMRDAAELNRAMGPIPVGVVEDVAGVSYEGMWNAQGYAENVKPILTALEERLITEGQLPEFKLAELGPEGEAMMQSWLKGVEGEMASTKLASLRWGETKRDSAMLNYSKRYGFDSIAELWKPYQFYYGRMGVQMGLKFLDHPAWFANYARIRMMQRNTVNRPGFPTRLQDKLKIPMAWLPEWAGGGIWVDPFKTLLGVDTYAGPFDKLYEQKNQEERRAEYLLQRWVEEGKVDGEAATQAMNTRSGAVWEQALTQAAQEIDAEISNPMDFLNLIVSNGLTWEVLGHMLEGDWEEFNVLPITRTGQNLRTVYGDMPFPLNLIGAAGDLLAKPEEYLRKRGGISEFGEWGDYYVDRMLSNMPGVGSFSTDDILMAMNERTGPAYEEAVRRVQYEQALRSGGALPAMALKEGANAEEFMLAMLFGWLPSGLLPEGELEQRGLKAEYDQAWTMYNAGDATAINTFFDENPEYRARLALWQEPEERLRQFLISGIWEKYGELEGPNKSLVIEQLGPAFENAFLNKETRSYDALDVETLSYWSRLMGALVPEAEGTAASGTLQALQVAGLLPMNLEQVPAEEAGAVQAYWNERNQEFPNWYAIQQQYYGLESYGEKQQFLRNFPELKEYWDWVRGKKEENPALLPYLENYKYEQWHYEHDKTPAKMEDGVEQYKAAFWKWYEQYGSKGRSGGGGGGGSDYVPPVDVSQFSPSLIRQLSGHFYAGQELGDGAISRLRQLWRKQGRPGGKFGVWLDVYVKGAFTGK